MSDASGATSSAWQLGIGRQSAALGLLWLAVGALASARAEEPPAMRRLPLVAQSAPAQSVPAVPGPASSSSENVVTFTERAAVFNETQPGSEVSAIRLVSAQEPPVRIGDPNAAFHLTADSEPTDKAHASPFFDEPVPPDAPNSPNADQLGNTDQKGDTDQQGDAEKKADGEPQTFGREPTNYSLQFLRDQDVLLNPGDWQFDTGFAYTLFDDDFPVPIIDGGGDVVDVVQARFRDRLLFTPLAFRYGWSKNVQVFGALPTGYSGTQLSTIGESLSRDRGGIGDLTAGASIHLLAGEELLPDVVTTLSVTAPTGVFNAPVGSIIPGTALGQGFWAMSAQLLFINRYDPIIAFYGVGFRHLFERDFGGVLFSPGEQLNYQFGVGFAANDRVTLSATFLGFYISQTLLNREALAGTNVEPMSLRFAATIARNDRIIEPFAQIGMTDFAPAASFGVTITFY